MGKSRPVTPGRLGGPCSSSFTPSPPKPKIKSKSKEKKEKSFKEETIKRLSSKSKCYCFNHSRTFQWSMAPPLRNRCRAFLEILYKAFHKALF